jgi:NADPH-dependent 2,4-dienoyl-CoA reductase/sulfur reductase-like enzyme
MAPVDPEMASALHQEIRSHGVDLRLRTALTDVDELFR